MLLCAARSCCRITDSRRPVPGFWLTGRKSSGFVIVGLAEVKKGGEVGSRRRCLFVSGSEVDGFVRVSLCVQAACQLKALILPCLYVCRSAFAGCWELIRGLETLLHPLPHPQAIPTSLHLPCSQNAFTLPSLPYSRCRSRRYEEPIHP